MKLASYLAEQKVTPSAFAALVGVPPSTITRIINGDRKPRLETIVLIQEATNGAVCWSDFVEQSEGEAA